jgi:hypothetical protein
MKVPRFRLSIRRMMIVVAIVAACFWGSASIRRRGRFSDMARIWGNTEAALCETAQGSVPGPHGDPAYNRVLAEYSGKMRMKYERAARYPWLPVEPDPPEPK